MSIKKANSFNHQVYQKAYQRLNLTSSQRIVFQRLLGFLIRNDKPFPFSVITMAELTGFDKRTIFRCLESLEHYRLIKRIGLGKNRRFCRGSILYKIISTVTNRTKIKLVNNITTATLCHKNLTNRDTMSYSKTSLSLKRKEKGDNQNQNLNDKILFQTEYQNYVKTIENDRLLKLSTGNQEILDFESWKLSYNSSKPKLTK
jgi:hypothetical protein